MRCLAVVVPNVEPAKFDVFDPDRCLNRVRLVESGKPSQCVRNAFEPCLYVIPLLEPEIRVTYRSTMRGDE